MSLNQTELAEHAAEAMLEKKGGTYCATCDGALPMFRNKPLVVVGGGDSACEEATFLTRFGSKVYLVHRRDELRASKIMAERALSNEKIEPVWDSEVAEILGVAEGKVTGVRLKDNKTGEEQSIDCAGVFVAIGHVPNTQIFKGQIDLDDAGYILRTNGSSRRLDSCVVIVKHESVTTKCMQNSLMAIKSNI